MKNSLSPNQIAELKSAHKKEKNRKYADRIKIILALNDGYSFEEVSKLFLLDDSTARDYLKRYQEGSVKSLLEVNHSGKTSFLSLEQEKKLTLYLDEYTFNCTKSIKKHILENYAKEYSCEGVRRLLSRLGFVYKKPKIMPGKVNKEKQEDFINSYNLLKQKALQENAEIYFSDGVHPTHNGKPNYGWILKKENKILKTASSRQRVNIQGAVSISKRDIITLSSVAINAQSTISLLNKIQNKNHSKNKVYVILDNARYHHSKKVKEWLIRNKKIELVFLPSYSPNLNVIERLWKYLNKKIIDNRYYSTFLDFKKKIRYFLSTTRSRWDELETLLTDNFQICDPKKFSEIKVA